MKIGIDAPLIIVSLVFALTASILLGHPIATASPGYTPASKQQNLVYVSGRQWLHPEAINKQIQVANFVDTVLTKDELLHYPPYISQQRLLELWGISEEWVPI